MKTIEKVIVKDFLTPENANKVNGGHELTFCASVELIQCAVAEGKYCGPAKASAHEIHGPVNPWGRRIKIDNSYST